jgi:hypothetical protein
VGLKGREIAATARPGTSLVFLVDDPSQLDELRARVQHRAQVMNRQKMSRATLMPCY